MKDIFNKDTIESYLDDKIKNDIIIKFFDVIDSTNDYLKKNNEDIKATMAVAVANEQTLGRGRKGRKFFSAKNSGIYISMLVRPKIEVKNCLFITIMSSVAALEAINEFLDVDLKIKWVNDLYLDDKKVSGTLTESILNSEGNGFLYVISGTGINVFMPEDGFDNEIENIAGALTKRNTDIDNIRSKIAAKFIEKFYNYYKLYFDGEFSLDNTFDVTDILEKYRNNSYLTGKDIYIIGNDEEKTYKVIGINDDGNLIIKGNDKKIITLNAGEVSVRVIK